jgi:glucosamine 6-phosphate synthetase-like amidotransferase/phosphosugar isomerase protein
MTELMKDILRQPDELIGLIARSQGEQQNTYEEAARLIREAPRLYIASIGASWHAGMAMRSLLDAVGWPASLRDASELLHFSRISAGAAVLLLSRSGKSIEIVRLLPDWQFLIDIIPAQLAAERLSHLRKVDCDSLRICSYFVESENGIIGDD